jgi:NitT/TauT family transport system ATP-binding protein
MPKIKHTLELDNVSVSYVHQDRRIKALQNLSFSVSDKEFLCIVGPSGCGKTTILYLIAGFIKPDSGKVMKNDVIIDKPSVDRGIVFQQHSLFEWKTVYQNIEFGLKMKRMPKDKCEKIIADYLKETDLLNFSESYPFELSVGMQQQIGRASCRERV